MNRRQDVIDAAAQLLRESGPEELTTVAVAARLGVTQSAIYRHVHNVDELATLASRQVLAEMQAELQQSVLSADMRWGDTGMTRAFSDLIVAVVAANASSFEIIDRWRYADGELGAGIRDMLKEGSAFGCSILDGEWRAEYGYAEPLTPKLQTIQRTYADLIQDDIVRISRLVRDGRFPGGRDSIERVLELRILGGYFALASDLNFRLGLRLPVIS